MQPDPDFRTAATWRRIGRVSVAVWVSVGLGFAASVVAARALGPGRYGAAVLAISVASLITTFLDLTLEEAVVHHGARALADDDISRLRGFLRTALVVDLGIGIGVSTLIVAFAAPLSEALSGGELDPGLLRLAALAPLVSTVDGTTGAVLLLARRPDLRAWSLATASLARLAFVLIAVQLGGPGAVLVAFALGSAAGSAVQGLAAWRVGWRRWPAVSSLRRAGGVRTLLTFGLHTSVATSVIAANRHIVKLVIGRVAGLRAVGILDAAMLPLSVVNLVSNPLRLWFFPEQARLWARGKSDVLRSLIRTYTLGGFGIGILGAAAGWFVLPYLIPAAYSERFADAVDPARIILVVAVVTLATAWRKNLPAAIGRPGIRTAMAVLELILLGAGVALLGGYGPAGGAAAMAISSVVVGSLWLLLVRRLLAAPERNKPMVAAEFRPGDE